MKQLVIFPRGQLAADDKRKMAKMGIVAVEADDPAKVVTLIPGVPISGDTLAMCALDAMAGSGYGHEAMRSDFAVNLHKRLKQREENGPRETPNDARK